MSNKVLGLWNMGDDRFHNLLSPIESKRLIKAAVKEGILSFDSAFSYRFADSYLYSALNEINIKRSNIRLISKAMPVPTLKKKVYTSLERIKTDYFDVLLLHWPTNEKQLYASLLELEELHQKGVAKEIGVSNFNLQLLKKAKEDFPISIHERALSLIWNKDYDEEAILDLKTYAYAPLAMGILTDRPIDSLSDSRKDLYFFKNGYNELIDLKEHLSNLSEKYNCTTSDIAYAWVEKSNPDSIIFGASKIEHIKAIANSSIKLDNEDYEKLKDIATNLTRKAPMDNIFSHEYLHH